MAIPLTPEEQARVNAYWGASPANSSVPGTVPVTPPQPDLGAQAFGGPPPAPAPPPSPPPGAFNVPAPIPQDFQARLDAALGPQRPAPQLVDPVTRAPEWDPSSINPKTISFAPPGQPAAAGKPLGPTPEDDAAFAAMQAKVTAPKPAPAAPRGPSKPGNPDPWGIRAAQKGLMGTYDAREEATRHLAAAEADKAAVIGDHHHELARRRTEDASINQMEQQYAAEHFESKMVELERQMDDVAAKKIDPKRLMKETPGLGFLAVIGGAIGGLYQGLTRSGENPFMKELNLMIDRDISAQEKEIDLGSRNVGQKMGLLGQQRAIFQDGQQAKLAAQALYYQAAEDELMAEASRYDQPIYKERAEMHAQEIRAEKQALLLKIAEQQRAQSMAAAGQAYTREKEVNAMYRDVFDKVLAKTGNPMLAENEARRQVAVIYKPDAVQPRQAPAGGVDPVGLVPPEQREKALEEQEKFVGAQRGKKAVQDLFAKYEKAPDLPTWTGADKREAVVSGARLNLRVALGKGFASDKDTETYIDKNLPRYGESEQARRQKLDNINNFLDSQAATPILDRHAPGWRPKDVERKDVK